MRSCAFLTTDDADKSIIYDYLAIPHLVERGWSVQDVSWRDSNVDYDAFDIVLVRSTWDYHLALDAFMACLERIEASRAVLENPLEVMRWNADKSYLRRLLDMGLPVVPVDVLDSWDTRVVSSAFERYGTDKIVVKPRLSAGARDTYILRRGEEQTVASQFSSRGLLIQPFLTRITEGEISLFYFNGELSHTVLKKPAPGDFRVQEEHGGELQAIEPSEEVRKAADKIMEALECVVLYARVDLVFYEGAPKLIEIELIEPSLYLNQHADAPARFAEAIDKRFETKMAVR